MRYIKRAMKTILLCADTDVERVSDQVKDITNFPFKKDEMEIFVYHVFRADNEGADASNLRSVQYAIENLKENGFSVEVIQSAGNPVPNIIETSRDINVDAISIAGRKRSPTGKVLFGSVAQQVILQTDLPVLFSNVNDK